jgi:hypothetical protein
MLPESVFMKKACFIVSIFLLSMEKENDWLSMDGMNGKIASSSRPNML